MHGVHEGLEEVSSDVVGVVVVSVSGNEVIDIGGVSDIGRAMVSQSHTLAS